MVADAGSGFAGIFVLFIIVWLVIGVASVGVWIWGLVDCVQRPEWAYTASGSNKTLWIVLIAVLGAIPSIIYLTVVRPKVRLAEASGPPPGYPYGAPPYGAPPYGAPPYAASAQGGSWCPRCGSMVAPGEAFCRRCGAKL